MSINSSIFAGVGRPQPIATAVRIPLSGPFNTLVVVHLRAASVIPGIMINNGRMERFHMSYPSSFVLVGFDQRFPPDFRHSTAGFLSYIATGDDATITYAIDAVSGHFDEIGRYWVDYEAAMLNDREVSAADCTLSSWVLVNEPRQDTRGLRRAWTASSTPNAQASRFSLPLEGEGRLARAAYECDKPRRDDSGLRPESDERVRMSQERDLQAKAAGRIVSTIDELANAADLEPTEKMPAIESTEAVLTVGCAERPEFQVRQVADARWSVHLRTKGSQVNLGLPVSSAQRIDPKYLLADADRMTARESYRPPWMKARFLPRIIPRSGKGSAQRFYDWDLGIGAGLHEGKIVSDGLMYAQLAERNWPWCTVGQVAVFTPEKIQYGSAVLVGPNLILTAGHLIPWNAPSGWSMLFRPAYRANDAKPAPFGASWIEHVYGYVVGDNDVNAHDYAVAKLQTPLGNTVGWMGSQSFGDDDGYKGASWLSVGYPGDSGMPFLASDIRVLDVDSSGAGRELETNDFLLHGWSGGPLIGFRGLDPYVLGIASGSETEAAFGWLHLTETHSVFAGGKPMVDLVKHGYATWPV